MHPVALRTSLAVTTLVVVLAIGVFGVWHAVGIGGEGAAEMRGCPLAGTTMLCTMSVLEHLAFWQSAFIAIPLGRDFTNLLLTVAVAALLGSVLFRRRLRLFGLHEHSPASRWFSGRQQSDTLRLDHLREAFSRGILHPKIFDLAQA